MAEIRKQHVHKVSRNRKAWAGVGLFDQPNGVINRMAMDFAMELGDGGSFDSVFRGRKGGV